MLHALQKGLIRAFVAGMLLPWGGQCACAAEPTSLAVVPLNPSVTQASKVEVDMLAVNRSASYTEFPLGEQVAATVSSGAQSWPVVLRAEPAEGAPPRVPAGGFISRRYSVTLPPEARGRAILEISGSPAGVLRTVIDILPPETPGPTSAQADAPYTPADAFLHQRMLAGRLSVNEPIYFIAGTEEPRGKFQISFKYRLLSFGGGEGPQAPQTLQLGYTQRSLWEFGPFYDTTYMPEVMYQWLATTAGPPSEAGGVKWLGLQSGLRHESNGQSDGSLERAINVTYVRPVFGIGAPEGWHALLEPEIWVHIGDVTPPDFNRYRGNGQLRMSMGKGDGASMMLTVLPGEHFQHGSRQLDLTIPVNLPALDFSTFILVQYFDGYAESLLTYNQHADALRAGIEFVR